MRPTIQKHLFETEALFAHRNGTVVKQEWTNENKPILNQRSILMYKIASV